jgi:hypothetical protein
LDLAPDLKIVDGGPDWFTQAQAAFSFGDCDDAALPVRKRLEHADLVNASWQPELHFKCLPRNRTHDIAAISFYRNEIS